MKRVKITLPKGGNRIASDGAMFPIRAGFFYKLEAEEIIIEGTVSLNQAPVITGDFRIPFDLEAAKAGAAIVTRDGRKVHFVAHDPGASVRRRVLVRIGTDDYQSVTAEDGSCYEGRDSQADLFMAPKSKKFLWLNIYPQGTNSGRDVGVHESEEKAKLAATSKCIGIAQRVEVDA